MRRKLNTPAIFLCALAMGVWVGASMHSASQLLTASSFGLTTGTCGSCCSLLASVAKTSKKTQIAASQTAPTGSECAACLAGALVQDAPSILSVVSFDVETPCNAAPILRTVRLSAHNHAHPPERGPPA